MFTCLEKIACVLGFHRYGDWAYVASIACEQLPACERCGQFRPVKNRTTHVWGDAAYAGEGSCNQIHTCLRCRAAQPAYPSVVHSLSEYAYASSDSCVMVRTCKRCQWINFDSAAIHHTFGEWVGAAAICQQLRNCPRCGSQEERDHHDWLFKPYGKICSQCHTTKPTEPGLCYQCGRRAIPGDNVCYSCI